MVLMKKKINLDLPATKRDLQNLATKEELKRVEKTLRGEMGQMERGLRLEMEVVAARWAEKTDEKNCQYKDEILTAVDAFAKEIKDSREERTIAAHQTEEDREKIDDHEQRITTLEQKFATPV